MSLFTNARRLRHGAGLGAVAVLVACTDTLGPKPQLRPNEGARSVQATYTYTLPTTTSSFQASVPLNYFENPTAVRITISGYIDAKNLGTAPNSDRRFGPFGWSQCGYGMDLVKYGSAVAWQPLAVCSPTSHLIESYAQDVVVQGQGVASRSGEWSQPCYDQLQQVCWAYSGSQTVKVEVLDFEVSMHAWHSPEGETSALRVADYVWFSWTPDSVIPGGTPKATYDWYWINDDGTAAAPVGYYGYEKDVAYMVKKSGTMYVNIKINGSLKTLEKHIEVGPIELGLRASPSLVDATGEQVTAEAFPVPEWLENEKPPVQVEVLEWTWTDSATAAVSHPCAASVNPCVFTTGRSGTLKVRGRVAGQEKTAETKITAIPCKTGNAILDSKAVRDALKAMYDRAVQTGNEQKIYIYRHADGSYEAFNAAIDAAAGGAQPCRIYANPPFPSTQALTLVAFAHPHLVGLGGWTNCPGELPQKIVIEGHNLNDFERTVWWDTSKTQGEYPDFGLESFVSDPSAIFRSHPTDLDPFTVPKTLEEQRMNWHKYQQKYPKQGGQCGW